MTLLDELVRVTVCSTSVCESSWRQWTTGGSNAGRLTKSLGPEGIAFRCRLAAGNIQPGAARTEGGLPSLRCGGCGEWSRAAGAVSMPAGSSDCCRPGAMAEYWEGAEQQDNGHCCTWNCAWARVAKKYVVGWWAMAAVRLANGWREEAGAVDFGRRAQAIVCGTAGYGRVVRIAWPRRGRVLRSFRRLGHEPLRAGDVEGVEQRGEGWRAAPAGGSTLATGGR
eukprot:scaffold15422_cov107-Isochrysis_galbana.AAC.4